MDEQQLMRQINKAQTDYAAIEDDLILHESAVPLRRLLVSIRALSSAEAAACLCRLERFERRLDMSAGSPSTEAMSTDTGDPRQFDGFF
jgi:hypothetical protein